jgi:hypothetical protein
MDGEPKTPKNHVDARVRQCYQPIYFEALDAEQLGFAIRDAQTFIRARADHALVKRFGMQKCIEEMMQRSKFTMKVAWHRFCHDYQNVGLPRTHPKVNRVRPQFIPLSLGGHYDWLILTDFDFGTPLGAKILAGETPNSGERRVIDTFRRFIPQPAIEACYVPCNCCDDDDDLPTEQSGWLPELTIRHDITDKTVDFVRSSIKKVDNITSKATAQVKEVAQSFKDAPLDMAYKAVSTPSPWDYLVTTVPGLKDHPLMSASLRRLLDALVHGYIMTTSSQAAIALGAYGFLTKPPIDAVITPLLSLLAVKLFKPASQLPESQGYWDEVGGYVSSMRVHAYGLVSWLFTGTWSEAPRTFKVSDLNAEFTFARNVSTVGEKIWLLFCRFIDWAAVLCVGKPVFNKAVFTAREELKEIGDPTSPLPWIERYQRVVALEMTLIGQDAPRDLLADLARFRHVLTSFPRDVSDLAVNEVERDFPYGLGDSTVDEVNALFTRAKSQCTSASVLSSLETHHRLVLSAVERKDEMRSHSEFSSLRAEHVDIMALPQEFSVHFKLRDLETRASVFLTKVLSTNATSSFKASVRSFRDSVLESAKYHIANVSANGGVPPPVIAVVKGPAGVGKSTMVEMVGAALANHYEVSKQRSGVYPIQLNSLNFPPPNFDELTAVWNDPIAANTPEEMTNFIEMLYRLGDPSPVQLDTPTENLKGARVLAPSLIIITVNDFAMFVNCPARNLNALTRRVTGGFWDFTPLQAGSIREVALTASFDTLFTFTQLGGRPITGSQFVDHMISTIDFYHKGAGQMRKVVGRVSDMYKNSVAIPVVPVMASALLSSVMATDATLAKRAGKRLAEFKELYNTASVPTSERKPPRKRFAKETFTKRFAAPELLAYDIGAPPRAFVETETSPIGSSSDVLYPQKFVTPHGSDDDSLVLAESEEDVPEFQMLYSKDDVIQILNGMGMPPANLERALAALSRAFPLDRIEDLAGGGGPEFLRPFLMQHVGELIPPISEDLYLAAAEDVRVCLTGSSKAGYIARSGRCFFLRDDKNRVCGRHGLKIVSNECAVAIAKELDDDGKFAESFKPIMLSEIHCPTSHNFFVAWLLDFYEGISDPLYEALKFLGVVVGASLVGISVAMIVNMVLGALYSGPSEQATGYDAVKLRSAPRRIPGKQRFEPSAPTSQGAIEIPPISVDGRADKIRRNMVKLWVKNPSAKAGCVCFATGILLRVAVTNRHPFEKLEPGAVMSVYGRTSRSVAVVRGTRFSKEHYRNGVAQVICDSILDVSYILFPIDFQQFGDVRHFIAPNSFDPEETSGARIVMPNIVLGEFEDSPGITVNARDIVLASYDGFGLTTLRSGNAWDFLRYFSGGTTREGDCGAPYLATVTNGVLGQHPWFGIHGAGDKNRAYAIRLDREYVDDFLANFFFPEFDEVPMQQSAEFLTYGTNPYNLQSYYGDLDIRRSPYVPTAVTLEESIFHGELDGLSFVGDDGLLVRFPAPSRAPVNLRPIDGVPAVVRAQGKKQPFLPRIDEENRAAYGRAAEATMLSAPSRPARFLTLDEALNGCSEWDTPGIDVKTSPGFPTVVEPGHLPGKLSNVLRGSDGKFTLAPETHARWLNIINCWRKNQAVEFFTFSCCKVENRRPAKVDIPRDICIFPVEVVIAQKMTFGAWVGQLKRTRVVNGMLYGIDFNSPEGMLVMKWLKRFSVHWNLDLENHDVTFNLIWALIIFFKNILPWYRLYMPDMTQEDENQLYQGWRSGFESMNIVAGKVYFSRPSNLSGSGLTTPVNMIDVKTLAVATWSLVVGNENPTLESFTQDVAWVNYSDDIAFSSVVLDGHAFKRIAESHFGRSITSGVKDTPIQPMKWQDLVIMKRRPCATYFVLTEDSLSEQITFVWGGPGSRQNTYEKIDAFLREMVLYGRDAFEKVKAKVNSHFAKVGWAQVTHNYNALRADLLSKRGILYAAGRTLTPSVSSSSPVEQMGFFKASPSGSRASSQCFTGLKARAWPSYGIMDQAYTPQITSKSFAESIPERTENAPVVDPSQQQEGLTQVLSAVPRAKTESEGPSFVPLDVADETLARPGFPPGKRLYLIEKISITSATAARDVLTKLVFPDALLTMPAVISSLYNYRYLRCKTKLTFVVACTPYTTGLVGIKYVPGVGTLTVGTSPYEQIVPVVSVPDYLIDLSSQSVVEYTLDWNHPYSFKDLRQAFGGENGMVVIFMQHPLASSTAATPANVQLSVYASFEDVQLAGPSNTIVTAEAQSGKKKFKPSEESVGKSIDKVVSGVGSTIEGVSALIEPVMKAIQTITQLVAFLDKPHDLSSQTPVVIRPMGLLSHIDGLDTGQTKAYAF